MKESLRFSVLILLAIVVGLTVGVTRSVWDHYHPRHVIVEERLQLVDKDGVRYACILHGNDNSITLSPEKHCDKI